MTRLTALTFALPFAFALTACNIEQTEKGEMPEVEVREGKLPEFDVDTVEVDVETRKTTVEVPVVDVTMPGEAKKAEGDDARADDQAGDPPP